MPNRVPYIRGNLPDETYGHDNPDDLRKLNLNPNSELKIADKYVHYNHCEQRALSPDLLDLLKSFESKAATIVIP